MRSNPPAPTAAAAHPARTEGSGAGAVTLLVLLLLVSGVDCRSAAAFQRVATGLVNEEVVGCDVARVVDRGPILTEVVAPPGCRDTSRGPSVGRTVTDAMLPAPRAPDPDQAA